MVQVHAPLRLTKLAPKATLDTLVIPLRPTESKLTALQPAAAPDAGDAAAAAPAAHRDLLPRGRVMHRLLLTYKLTLAEGGTVKPVLPPLAAAVYDGALEGQVYALYDSNCKRLSFGDVYPKDVTLPKGRPPLHPPQPPVLPCALIEIWRCTGGGLRFCVSDDARAAQTMRTETGIRSC